MFLLIDFKLCFKMIVLLSLTCLMVSNLFVFFDGYIPPPPLPNHQKVEFKLRLKLKIFDLALEIIFLGYT